MLANELNFATVCFCDCVYAACSIEQEIDPNVGVGELPDEYFDDQSMYLLYSTALLPCDALSARHSIAIVGRPSVCNVEVRGHICWTSSELITHIISIGSSRLGATTPAI